jgi:hypothetical protein
MKRLLAIAILLSSFGANASSFSFTGSFSDPNEVQYFNFSVSSTGDLLIRTLSHGGGVMADGTVVEAGGFDPVLTVFRNKDDFPFLVEVDDCIDLGSICDTVNLDPNFTVKFDAVLTSTSFIEQDLSPLEAGNYILALTQFENFANPPILSKGFSNGAVGYEYPVPNSTVVYSRTKAWALDIIGVDSAEMVASVPIPATAWLFGTAFIGLLGLRKKQ